MGFIGFRAWAPSGTPRKRFAYGRCYHVEHPIATVAITCWLCCQSACCDSASSVPDRCPDFLPALLPPMNPKPEAIMPKPMVLLLVLNQILQPAHLLVFIVILI